MDVLILKNIAINKKYSETRRIELHRLFLEKNLSVIIKLLSEVNIPKAEGYYFT